MHINENNDGNIINPKTHKVVDTYKYLCILQNDGMRTGNLKKIQIKRENNNTRLVRY